MDNSSAGNLKVRITKDEMEAYLELSPSNSNVKYSKEQLLRVLNSQKVVYGIDEEALEQMIKARRYHKEVCVARGTAPMNGEDGVLNYHFDTTSNGRLEIHEDADEDQVSVLHPVELVKTGDVIASRTDPTAPKNGMTVSAKPILAKRGKEAAPPRGKGFHESDDGRDYIADLSGKVELVNGSVRIFEVYEVAGDVGIKDSPIDFQGDVVIRGNITPGASVKASGSIIVDGTSENCTLDAGKDIVLRGGVVGGNKTRIRCSGNIQAKFFEYCQIHADGSIVTEWALDSQIECYEMIIMTGKKACLVGGNTYATGGIRVHSVGNSSEIKTEVEIGARPELLRDIYNTNRKMTEAEDLIAKINAGLQQYDEFAMEHGTDSTQDERRIALFRTRMMKQAEVATLKKEINRMQEIIVRGKRAALTVLQDVYPGTIVTIGGDKEVIKSQHTSVEFVLSGDIVVMHPRNKIIK